MLTWPRKEGYYKIKYLWKSIVRIVVSDKVLFGKKGFKYFVGYRHDSEKIMPLSSNASKYECI